MKKIVIVARESGTSTGRSVDNLVKYMHKLEPKLNITILSKSHRRDYFAQNAPNYKFIDCNIKEFSLTEQLLLPIKLWMLRPSLTHFSMTHQPILYTGKTITTIHDLTTARFDINRGNYLLFKFRQQVYKFVAYWAAKKSKHILTVSEFVRQDIARFANVSPNKITVTYNSADFIENKPSPVESLTGKAFIFYVGQAVTHKNLPRLIDAFKLVQKTHPALHLAIAGKKDPLHDQLQTYAESKQIKNIVFTGFVDDAQLKWMYQNCSAYVFPSLSEGYGIPGIEAMVHGAPVVSSDATCLPEIYGDAAHYFDPYSIEDMAQKISDVIDDNKLAKSLISKGNLQAHKYSWSDMAKTTVNTYKDFL